MLPIIPRALTLAKMFAPNLVEYMTGSDAAGAVASKIVDIAGIVTGGAPDPVAALMADPAKAMEFQKALMDNETELVRMHLAEVQDARKMQIAALGQDDLFSKRFVYYFAAAWSAFAMLYFLGVTFIPIPPEGTRVADTILGVMISSVIGVMFAYFYGSTRGGTEKSRLLALTAPPK